MEDERQEAHKEAVEASRAVVAEGARLRRRSTELRADAAEVRRHSEENRTRGVDEAKTVGR